jgi:hypothetical protein
MRKTAEYVEGTWRGRGCRYFGAFVVSNALRDVCNDYVMSVGFTARFLPENIALQNKIADPEHFNRCVYWYKDLTACIKAQVNAMHVKTVMHYYAYNKLYLGYDKYRNKHVAHVVALIQQTIANGYLGKSCNYYSTLVISEQGSEFRPVCEKIL